MFVLICFPAALWTQTWIERSLEPVTDTVDAMKRLDALNRIFYAYDIIMAHGGEIQVDSREQEGVEFIIRLPKD